MELVLIQVTIEGTTPLILNRFTDEAAMKATSQTSSSITGDRGSPLEQAEKKLYLGIDGKTLVIPQPNLFRMLIDAGTFFKVGKSKVTTQKTSLIPACVEVKGTEIPIEFIDPWCVDTRPVRIPSTGGRILCHRPMFHDWRLSFEVEVDTSMMGVKLFRELVDAGGKRIGVGDFRPACKGPFGKFVVVKWVIGSETNGKAETKKAAKPAVA
jgi:hypothetical protein